MPELSSLTRRRRLHRVSALPLAPFRKPPPLGFVVPSSRHKPAASFVPRRHPFECRRGRQDSNLSPSPSSAFRTPSTVSSATGRTGLFHPAATSRVLGSGYRSLDIAPAVSSTTAALSPVSLVSATCTLRCKRHRNDRRPQGFVLCRDPLSPAKACDPDLYAIPFSVASFRFSLPSRPRQL